MKEVIWAKKNPEAIIEKIADKNTKIISLTITEGGYNIDKTTGEFILNDDAVAHDLNNPTEPTTAFGYVAEGLRRRRNMGHGGITILSCDNLQHNGNTAKKAFLSFFEAWCCQSQ